MQFVIIGFATDLNDGAYLSYSCADMMPFVSEAAVRYAAAHSFAGDLRIREQQRACSIFGVPAMPASFNAPLRSNAPILMILGSDDPATPARYGLAALKYLPNARAVMVKGGGHGADTPCTDKLVLRFIRSRSAKALPVDSCTTTFTLPPFKTSLKGLPALP
jgi:pimeloyl-ACP methyl ester carboxylesterase